VTGSDIKGECAKGERGLFAHRKGIHKQFTHGCCALGERNISINWGRTPDGRLPVKEGERRRSMVRGKGREKEKGEGSSPRADYGHDLLKLQRWWTKGSVARDSRPKRKKWGRGEKGP